MVTIFFLTDSGNTLRVQEDEGRGASTVIARPRDDTPDREEPTRSVADDESLHTPWVVVVHHLG
jgi:hypothetical protein